MLRDPGPKGKFTIMLIAMYVVSLPIISTLTYLMLRHNAVSDAYSVGRLRLTTMESIKTYVAEELRPIFYREMPGRFIVEGMSRSYVAGSIARKAQEEYPGYLYKNASLNPMNPQNTPDSFEIDVINTFIKDRSVREWSGFRETRDGEYYVIARAGETFSTDCLRCHGDPAVAPAELIQRYGTSSGFGMMIGQLVDAKFVYIPIHLPMAAARKAVAAFIGLYTLFFGLLFLVIHMRFTGLYDHIENDKRRIEETNLELLNLNRDMEALIAERTLNLIALSVADRVRNPATAIAGTFNRILKKEQVSEPLKERMQDLLMESQKLDSIVKDYETILKSRQIMFRVEDLNEVAQSVLPFVEREIKEKRIDVSLLLSSSPARFVGNKQLIKVAVLHIVKNAIEATPEAGKISIKTSSGDDYVQMHVVDTGKGMPPDELNKIFSLFYSTKKHRVGMGLPLTKQIIEEHKGEIKVESEPGKGTTFTITLPVRWSEHDLKEG